MVATMISPVKHRRNSLGFIDLLSSAACEWVLIFFLLVDALLSYLVTKFAEYCQLQLPCLLCSKLNHPLGNKTTDSYSKLLCRSHKSVISSLVSCHTHAKLADVRGLCEDCLISYATQSKSNPESYRLLVGRLGLDLGYGGGFLNPESFCTTTYCSCCGKAWMSKQKAKPFGAKVGMPLPTPLGRNRLNRQNGLKKMRNKVPTAYKSFDPLSSAGYSRLKVASDSESEMLCSNDNDDNRRNAIHKKSDSTPESLLLDLHQQPEKSGPQKASASDFAIWHGLKELNWQQIHQRSNSSGLPELISLDVPSSSENGVILTSSNSTAAGTKSENLKDLKRERSTLPAESHAVINSHGDKEDSRPILSESRGIKSLQRPESPERSESGIESLDESSIGEVESENESAINKLKRKAEHARKRMNTLYKELEEERSASTIAANQAMAMITRLQEEKAALHMEALQYLRMMEEQAEYDVEALEKANDLLSEKEKEIQDLETELEFFRNQVPNELVTEYLHEEASKNGVSGIENNVIAHSDSTADFEEEKKYISESLKKMGEKIHQAFDADDSSVPVGTLNDQNIDLAALKGEIAGLGERLKALEADSVFLKHTSHCLQNGNEGLQFIEEIAHHLQELREIGRCLPFPQSF